MPDTPSSESAGSNASPPQFDPTKELELFVKSIEEASKHCREVLIALLSLASR